jgi:hypothetical protein
MRPYAIHTALLHRLFAFLLVLAAGAAFAAPGDTDLIVKTRIPGGSNHANRVIVQPDGKYLTAGVARFGTLQFVVTRYNADGSIDTGFG